MFNPVAKTKLLGSIVDCVNINPSVCMALNHALYDVLA